MQKTLYTLTLVLLISCFITLPNALGDNTGTLKSFFNNKTGFYYTVQKGDTLWDLSQKFYSSEWDWPGLWKLNDKIRNPHLIYPGERLKVFFKGGLSLENRPIYVEPVKKEPVEITVEKIEKIAVSEPEKPEIKLTFFYPYIDRVGFIKRNAVSPAGKILRSKENADLISENDIVYIEAAETDSLIPGKQYHVYETTEIPHKGIRHSIKGIVQIKEYKNEYFTAKIIETYIDINPGDPIMNFIERDKEFEVKKNNNLINAKLICNDEDNSIYGDSQIAYMDIGENDNIEIGQIYTIYKDLDQKKALFSKKAIGFEPIETGKLIVLHTEDISSTVLIFIANQEIRPRDSVH